jgi:hypothetical protein
MRWRGWWQAQGFGRLREYAGLQELRTRGKRPQLDFGGVLELRKSEFALSVLF